MSSFAQRFKFSDGTAPLGKPQCLWRALPHVMVATAAFFSNAAHAQQDTFKKEIVAFEGVAHPYIATVDQSIKFCFANIADPVNGSSRLWDPSTNTVTTVQGRCSSLTGFKLTRGRLPSLNGSEPVYIFGDKTIAWVHPEANQPNFGPAFTVEAKDGAKSTYQLLEITNNPKPFVQGSDPGTQPPPPQMENMRSVLSFYVMPVTKDTAVIDIVNADPNDAPLRRPVATFFAVPYPVPGKVRIGRYVLLADEDLIDPATQKTFSESANNPISATGKPVDLNQPDQLKSRYCVLLTQAAQTTSIPVIDPFAGTTVDTDFAVPKPPSYCPKKPDLIPPLK